MNTLTNHGSKVALPIPTNYHIFNEPVREVDGGRAYWRYRAGGYDPADGTYGRCMDLESAESILRKSKIIQQAK